MRQLYALRNSNRFCGDHNPAGAVGSVRETSHAGGIAPVIPGLFFTSTQFAFSLISTRIAKVV
jgi:hypothetical protein